MAGQLTILVKKKDGTQVRMTMEEFRLYRENENTVALNVESNVEEKKKVVVEDKEIRDREIKKSEVVKKIEDREIKKNENRQPIAEIRKANLPMKDEHHELSTTTPVKDIFVDEALYTKTQKHKNTKTLGLTALKQENKIGQQKIISHHLKKK